MEIDLNKIDDTVLGLLWLTLHDERRAWKGFDWDAMDRLHKKGLITDPANKAKSVVCQSALDRDPVSASKRDPFERRVLPVALAPSELAGVAETERARACA